MNVTETAWRLVAPYLTERDKKTFMQEEWHC